jgi:hypothetical protein
VARRQGEATVTAISAHPNFDIGRVIERAFGSISHNFLPFLIIAALFGGLPQILLAIGQTQITDSANTASGWPLLVVGGFFAMAGGLIMQGAIVKGTVSDLSGQKSSFGDLFQTGCRFALPLLGLGIIYGLMLMLGLICLIIPAFIVLTVFSVAAPSLVIERTGVFGSLQRSRDLTRGHRWGVFGVLVVFWVLSLVVGMIIGVVGVVAGFSAGASLVSGEFVFLRAIINGVSGTLQGLITAASIASIYYELRSIKEGVAPQSLLSVFD